MLHRLQAAPEATSVEVFVGSEKTSRRESSLTVPAGTDTLRFLVKPKPLCVRYKLEGLDEDWNQRTDTMFVRVIFTNAKGDPIHVDSFPASGRSPVWNRSVEDSVFSPRVERVTVPPGAASVIFTMSTAGPASLVGTYAIKHLSISTESGSDDGPGILISSGHLPDGKKAVWAKSGTHPSMASTSHSGDSQDSSPVLVIVDDDIGAHADWTTRTPLPPWISAGQTLKISWEETYCTALGGDFTATYERLPPGKYRFVVEDLSLTGETLPSNSVIPIFVPVVFWKSLWFWGTTTTILALVSILIGRYLIRRRIRRHLEQERMISDERRRIALDLHDDIGTRVSHISLVASHADNTIRNEEAREAFGQITSMSRDLIGALSETVWMLSPNNDDLESLVDFLYRLVQELCRLKKIRCRVDAVFITKNQPISYEFRHNMSLAVKESVNNVLKHSQATELDMKIELENNFLMVTITDNGIGISETSRSTGHGLESIQSRMKSIGGTCRFEHLAAGGLRILLRAPAA
ncbi:MAG: histidine kinase [Akkermansiaceae bacterium]|nr:histidine kinase [Akkermansiaceae bacterium]